MQPVFRRIAIHGTLAAAILAVIGIMFAELASIWMASSPPPAPVGGAIQVSVDVDVSDALHRQVPLRMAIMGFVIVAIGETLLHFWRQRKPATPANAARQPDDAERLLEQLLTESESRANSQAVPGGTRHAPEHAAEPLPKP